MAVERTLSIIKPDAVGKNVIGQIISRFEERSAAALRGSSQASGFQRARGQSLNGSRGVRARLMRLASGCVNERL